MSKPKVFIGSSTSALGVARYVQSHLEDMADVTVWRDLPGHRTLNKTIIEAIIGILNDYDFAIMIFAADDEANRGEDMVFVPRDNVVFELGLFVAHIGRERTFILREIGVELKTASDLTGVLTANYNGRAQNLASSLNTPCVNIRDVINSLGVRSPMTVVPSDEPLRGQIEELLRVQAQTGVRGIHIGMIPDALGIFKNLVQSGRRVRILQTWTPDIVRLIETELVQCLKLNEGTVEVLLIAPGPIATQRRTDQVKDLNLDNLTETERKNTIEDHINDSREEIKSTLHALNRVRTRCTTENTKERLQVRLYNQLPSIAFYMCDEQAFLGYFQKGERASRGIFLHIDGADSLTWQSINEEFDQLWSRAQHPDNYKKLLS